MKRRKRGVGVGGPPRLRLAAPPERERRTYPAVITAIRAKLTVAGLSSAVLLLPFTVEARSHAEAVDIAHGVLSRTQVQVGKEYTEASWHCRVGEQADALISSPEQALIKREYLNGGRAAEEAGGGEAAGGDVPGRP